MLQLSSSICSQAEVLGEINAGDTFCNLSGTRDRAVITDDGTWGIPCAMGGLGMWQQGQSSDGQPDGRLINRDHGKKPAPKWHLLRGDASAELLCLLWV